jgi:copper chaperone
VTIDLKVQGMTCGHCAAAVTRAIQAKDPAAKVVVDLAGGRVSAETRLPRAEVAAAVVGEGYEIAA